MVYILMEMNGFKDAVGFTLGNLHKAPEGGPEEYSQQKGHFRLP